VAVVDAVGVLSGPKVWPEKDQQGMEKWFGSFLEWLQQSPSGRGEAASANNHTLPCSGAGLRALRRQAGLGAEDHGRGKEQTNRSTDRS